jgi:hypothetical protein
MRKHSLPCEDLCEPEAQSSGELYGNYLVTTWKKLTDLLVMNPKSPS